MKEIQDFNDIDMRVGTVVDVKDFPEARKDFYKITIDFGKLGFYNSSAQITVNYSKEELVGKKIRIDGFMVPLDFDYGEALTVEEFVLVPDAGMCIHVPPPPPNQMIFIKLNKPEKVRYMYQPIAVEGILKNTPPIKNVYNSIYEMSVETIEDIDFEDLNY